MKPTYDPYIRRWSVKGLGYFDSLDSAKEAIRNINLSDTLLLRINPVTKKQLQELANSRKVSVSDVIRQAIEKEVTNYGNEKENR